MSRKLNGKCRLVAIAALAIGCGVLLTFFISLRVLVVAEAILLIAAGILLLRG